MANNKHVYPVSDIVCGPGINLDDYFGPKLSESEILSNILDYISARCPPYVELIPWVLDNGYYSVFRRSITVIDKYIAEVRFLNESRFTTILNNLKEK